MKIHFDREKCQGHGRCYALVPDLFDCDDEGYAIVRNVGELDTAQEQGARLAADSCPEFAITVE